MTRLGAIIAVALVAFGLGGCSSEPNVYERAADSVVKISDDTGHGSGVIISPDGFILTNRHVVEDMKTFTVTTSYGSTFEGHVLWTGAPGFDLALVKVNAATPLTAAPIRTSPLRLGEAVFALGSPGDFDFSLSQGHVANLKRNIEGEDLVQLDLDINPGNSGGGLFDAEGRLVGLPSQIALINLSPFMPPLATDISFAVPIRSVCMLMQCPR